MKTQYGFIRQVTKQFHIGEDRQRLAQVGFTVSGETVTFVDTIYRPDDIWLQHD